jgi:acyl dehydratase
MTSGGYGIRQVGPQRFREDPGRYYEDFTVGDVYEHWPGRTITETDNVWFTNLTMNTHPIHFDANYAAQTEFGRLLVNSTLTLSLVVGMAVSGSSQKAIANLGWEEIKMPAPVFVGDTLYAETEVLGKRESKSRPNDGIVRVRHIGRNQDGVVVIDMIRSFLVPKRGHGVIDRMLAEKD